VSDRIIHFRYLVTQPDLNSHGSLHGGILMKWADESAGMHARKLTGRLCVTRYIDRINFVETARVGSVIRITSRLSNVGTTSLTFSSTIKDDLSGKLIASIDKLVFVCINSKHIPAVHGISLDGSK